MSLLLSFASAISVIAPVVHTTASFTRRPEVAHIQCDRLFNGDAQYASGLHRQALIPTPEATLDMGCEAVRKRVFSRRNPPTGFFLAFVKLVYKDYELLEEQLAVSYNEENTFCFAIDKKAPLDFHLKIEKLASCFENVLLSSKEHTMESTGRGQSAAQLDCLRRISNRQWFYVIMQQNHDIIIKTNAEMGEIFMAMGGANDMEWLTCPADGRCYLKERNLGKLGICPKNLNKSDLADCEKEDMTMAKGAMEFSLTHATVEYLLDTLNTTGLIDQLDQRFYGMDELFLQSVFATRALRMPGMFPARCLFQNTGFPPSNRFYITRIAQWNWMKDTEGCRSNIWRHNVCIFGVEDLPYLAGVHHLMANKMMPDIDYAAISCIGELLYNRTHFALKDHPLDMSVYENLPAVRLHKGILADPTYFDRFECPKLSSAPEEQQNSAIIPGLQNLMLLLIFSFLHVMI